MSSLERVNTLEHTKLKMRVSASHDSGAALTIDRSAGAGATFNPRELLCLAVGGCYVDDLF